MFLHFTGIKHVQRWRRAGGSSFLSCDDESLLQLQQDPTVGKRELYSQLLTRLSAVKQ